MLWIWMLGIFLMKDNTHGCNGIGLTGIGWVYRNNGVISKLTEFLLW